MKKPLRILNSFLFIIIICTAFLFSTCFENRCSAAFAENLLNPTEAAQKVQSEFGKFGNNKTVTQQNASTAQNKTSSNNTQDINFAGITFSQSIFKFLKAMLGVLASIIVIFLGLKLYQKMFLKNKTQNNNILGKSLDSPKDFKEAINIFLEKTDKE